MKALTPAARMTNKKELSERVDRKVGNIVKIMLPNGHWCPALVLPNIEVVCFDLLCGTEDEFDLDQLSKESSTVFTCGVFAYALSRNNWPVLGKRPDLVEHFKVRRTFLRDIGKPGSFRLYTTEESKGGYERIATDHNLLEGLELVAAWDHKHVAQRLLTYFFRKPLYEVEYGQYVFRNGRVNDSSLVFGAKAMQQFRLERFFPMVDPPAEYHRLAKDEERVHFAGKHFHPSRGWSIP